jgi:hypothetical protein
MGSSSQARGSPGCAPTGRVAAGRGAGARPDGLRRRLWPYRPAGLVVGLDPAQYRYLPVHRAHPVRRAAPGRALVAMRAGRAHGRCARPARRHAIERPGAGRHHPRHDDWFYDRADPGRLQCVGHVSFAASGADQVRRVPAGRDGRQLGLVALAPAPARTGTRRTRCPAAPVAGADRTAPAVQYPGQCPEPDGLRSATRQAHAGDVFDLPARRLAPDAQR